MDIVSSHSWSQTEKEEINLLEKCKEIERKKSERNRSKNEQKQCKQSKNRALRDFHFAAKPFRNSFDSSAKIFAAAKPILAHECHFAAQEPPIRSCETPDVAQTSDHLLRSSLPAKFRQSEMARTRGAKSSSPSSRKRVPRGAPVRDPTSEPPRPKIVSPPSPVPSPEPSPAPSPALPAEPQELQPPLSEPQIPSEIAPEALIRRPMLTQPPIEGNLDCRARPFHSELCFDTTTFQLRPELAHSFRLA
ncbi:hypothetical protein AAG906_027244 [Vitis piasezkii]